MLSSSRIQRSRRTGTKRQSTRDSDSPGGMPFQCIAERSMRTGTGTVGFRSPAEISVRMESCNYCLLSSLASATWAWCPASDTAFTNASALAGIDALPERMLRNIM